MVRLLELWRKNMNKYKCTSINHSDNTHIFLYVIGALISIVAGVLFGLSL